jgi:hypothetical protein
MATTKLGDCSYIYGIDTDEAIAGMIITGLTKETTPEFEAEATDDTGSVKSVIQGGDKITYTVSGYAEASATLATHGGAGCTTIIDGNTCIIEKWSINSNNNDFSKCELTASTYPATAAGDYCCTAANA